MKKPKHLTSAQRYQIEALLQGHKHTISEISVIIGKDKSVLSRELRRNSHKNGTYTGKHAQMLCDERKERFKRRRSFTREIRERILSDLQNEQWSPAQIVGLARKEDRAMVSHERIYQFIRSDKEKGGSLYLHLRHALKHRKRPVSGKQITIKNKVSIDLRPEIINRRLRFGDWEIDTIIGREGKGAIVTITERITGLLLMRKLNKGKEAKHLAKVVIQMLLPYKAHVHSITSDNGTEFAEHLLITKKLETAFYFAHPYSSWERGLNEYTNGLIRQYIPKGKDFEEYNDLYIKNIQHKINRRPREKLAFDTPVKRFFAYLNKKVALGD